jgi:hypothetical protein
MQARLIRQAEMCGGSNSGRMSETDEEETGEGDDEEGDKRRGIDGNRISNNRTRNKANNKPEDDEEETKIAITNEDINEFMRTIANPRTTVRAMETLTEEQF